LYRGLYLFYTDAELSSNFEVMINIFFHAARNAFVSVGENTAKISEVKERGGVEFLVCFWYGK